MDCLQNRLELKQRIAVQRVRQFFHRFEKLKMGEIVFPLSKNGHERGKNNSFKIPTSWINSLRANSLLSCRSVDSAMVWMPFGHSHIGTSKSAKSSRRYARRLPWSMLNSANKRKQAAFVMAYVVTFFDATIILSKILNKKKNFYYQTFNGKFSFSFSIFSSTILLVHLINKNRNLINKNQ